MIIRPKTNCLDCLSFTFIYKTPIDTHHCLECECLVEAKHIENILNAFILYNSKILPSYKVLKCLKCEGNDSLHFGSNIKNAIYCSSCDYYLHATHLCDIIANKHKTILLEKSFNFSF